MLKKAFKIIDQTLGFVEDWSLFITVTGALLIAFANIVLRKTGSFNIYWSDEVVRKVIYFSTYIGASAAIRSRTMIRIDAVPQIFPRSKRLLTLINHIAMIGFGVLLVWLGYLMTMQQYKDPFALTTTLRMPEWYLYAVMPLLGVMSVLRSLIVMVEDWRGMDGNNGS